MRTTNRAMFLVAPFFLIVVFKNVVYELNCNNCEATYVGQKRQLKTRIAEYRNHIKRNTSTHSMITDHRIISDHDFD